MYIYVYINYRSKSLPESTKKISLSYIRIYTNSRYRLSFHANAYVGGFNQDENSKQIEICFHRYILPICSLKIYSYINTDIVVETGYFEI